MRDEGFDGISRELSVAGGKTTVQLLAVLLGILGLSGWAAGAAVAAESVDAARETCKRIHDRRQEREFKRLQLLVKNLQKQVANIAEVQSQSEERVDLLIHVLEQALQDDEDAKSPIYAALLETVLSRNVSTVHIRVLAAAVRNLSYLELFVFVGELSGRAIPRDLLETHGFDEQMYLHRLEGSGLSTHGVRMKGSPTRVGQTLKSMLSSTVLDAPT